MLPTLAVVIGDVRIEVSLYALATAIGVAATFLVAVRRARRPDLMLLVAPLAGVAALAGAAAWYRALHGGSGFSSMGGVVAGLAAVAVARAAAGVDACELLDAGTPGVALGLGIGRLGCFLGGCCYGRPTALPWGVVFPDLGLPPRHPTQLYAAVADVALAAWLLRTRGPTGTITRRALVGYGLVRLALEWLRDPAAADLVGGGALDLTQLGAAALVVVGLGLRPARVTSVPRPA